MKDEVIETQRGTVAKDAQKQRAVEVRTGWSTVYSTTRTYEIPAAGSVDKRCWGLLALGRAAL